MKTLKIVEIVPIWFDDSLPLNEECLPNHLYISRKYHGIKHKCLCGCGTDTYIKYNAEGELGNWTLTVDDKDRITLTPSLLNTIPCRSHYIITKNKANFV